MKVKICINVSNIVDSSKQLGLINRIKLVEERSKRVEGRKIKRERGVD